MKYFNHILIGLTITSASLFMFNDAMGQSVGISTNGSYSINPKAILDLDGGTVTADHRGLLPPRMNATERDNFLNNTMGIGVQSSAEGMMIYNETSDRYEMWVYDATATPTAGWEWKKIASEDDLGGGAYIKNQTTVQATADYNIDGSGVIGTTLSVGSTIAAGDGIRVGNNSATPTVGQGNILMTVDGGWIGRGGTAPNPRIAFDATSGTENIKIYPTNVAQVLINKVSATTSGSHNTALTIENTGGSNGVGIKLSGNRGTQPSGSDTREVGFIDFENTYLSPAIIGRIGVANPTTGTNNSGVFKISLLDGAPTPALQVRLTLDKDGNMDITGKFTSNGIKETSDGRFKKNINGISNALSTVLNLEGVTYNWRTEEFPNRSFTDRMEYGVIAQQIEKFVPELVDTDENGYKSVQYSHMVPLLLEAIKEQQNIINSQSKELGVLKASVEAIAEHLKTANK